MTRIVEFVLEKIAYPNRATKEAILISAGRVRIRQFLNNSVSVAIAACHILKATSIAADKSCSFKDPGVPGTKISLPVQLYCGLS
ncbi:hypothetical protein CASFOL_022434 [Castilleja foliolosa]|uniref:Uncharacterized protein n=1 Tax=Castilleja foliolosa TaxID=1961234 RepID=A0ABD3CVJ6_9LAMI